MDAKMQAEVQTPQSHSGKSKKEEHSANSLKSLPLKITPSKSPKHDLNTSITTPSKRRKSGLIKEEDLELSKTQIADYTEAFNFIDRDGSGRLDAQQLHTVFEALGEKIPLSDVKRMINDVTQNAEGLDLIHFLYLMSRKMKNAEDDKLSEMKAAFAQFDQNKDGFLSISDLDAVIKHLHVPSETARLIIEKVTEENSISFQQFLELLE